MRRASYVLLPFVLSMALAACGTGEQATDGENAAGDNGAETAQETENARASLQDTEGEELGEVTFAQQEDGVAVEASLNAPDLAHDFHGFHVHEVGTCEPDAPDGPFSTAEGHFNPDDTAHGGHAGDMPPLHVTEDGAADLTFVTDRFEIADLTAEDGTAVIVHTDRDNLGHIPERYESTDTGEPGPDEETQDTGDAGDRALCGVVEPA